MTTYTKVADLTIDELTLLIQNVVKQTIMDLLGDPDVGLELQDAIKTRLQRSLASVQSGQKTIPAQDVAAKLGLEW
ncbi:hypothetical protein QUF64_15380 [Anaerolineales bacterium HSG6]|nr:hypothetical protein [Anaerolineales bacterium HSG6]MDM8530895.1 hypothetical protein [Anaerolineales bacterium HSG25]